MKRDGVLRRPSRAFGLSNSEQKGPEIVSVFYKSGGTVSVRIRSLGITESVISQIASFLVTNGNKVGAEFPFLSPIVEKNGSVTFFDNPVKTVSSEGRGNFETFGPKINGRSKQKSSEVTVDQWYLLFIIADQFFRFGTISHEPQSVVGGDPAAAGGCAAAETIAPFLFGNLMLVINKIIHDFLCPEYVWHHCTVPLWERPADLLHRKGSEW